MKIGDHFSAVSLQVGKPPFRPDMVVTCFPFFCLSSSISFEACKTLFLKRTSFPPTVVDSVGIASIQATTRPEWH